MRALVSTPSNARRRPQGGDVFSLPLRSDAQKNALDARGATIGSIGLVCFALLAGKPFALWSSGLVLERRFQRVVCRVGSDLEGRKWR
jgi:hypothetical protein